MAISTAINTNQISAVVGYEVQQGFPSVIAGALPQRIAVFAEVPSTITDLTPLDFTSANAVGQKYGFGTPSHIIARILRPLTGDKLGSIPTTIYPVEAASGAVATSFQITVTGPSTDNTTHTLTIAGRNQIDGSSYNFAIAAGDTAETVAAAITDTINNVLGCPVTATINETDAYIVDIVANWEGLSSAGISITVSDNDDAAGLTYTVDKTNGSGIPSISDALAYIENEWTTLVVNAVGDDETILDSFETFNGNINDKTGRYDATIFKPFISLFGSVESDINNIISITDDRALEMTNVLCPAPNSLGLPMEAAANVAAIIAPIMENDPSRDSIYNNYPDMPIPSSRDIGDFTTPTQRDTMVKIGASTVDLNVNSFRIIDLVTTYHPSSEPVGLVTYRWVRDLAGIDWNIAYQYLILIQLYVIGKTIIEDGKSTTSRNTISISNWKSIVNTFSDSLVVQALTADSDFMKDSIQVAISSSNPNRFETFFQYKRTGVARVVPTTVETNPNVGELNI